MIKRILAMVAVLVAAVVMAAPAQAGGILNFYNGPYNCRPAGDLRYSLKGVATNYDIRSFTDQQYHHYLTPANGNWRAYGVYYNGYKWPVKVNGANGYSGKLTDGYQNYASPVSDHSVAFKWRNVVTGQIVGCTIYTKF